MLNKVLLIGNLVNQPELRYTPAGNATCTFKLACDNPIKGQDGEKSTSFLPIVVPPYKGKLAENVANYLDKGKRAYVEGFIQVRKYTDQGGNDHWTTEVIALDVKFLTPKSQGGNSLGQEVNDEEIPF